MINSRPMTVQELTDIIESDEWWENYDVSKKIYIASPDEHNVSDDDSADEDSGGLLDNLSSHQLQAEAEAVSVSGRRISYEQHEENLPTTSHTKQNKENKINNWAKDNLKKRKLYKRYRFETGINTAFSEELLTYMHGIYKALQLKHYSEIARRRDCHSDRLGFPEVCGYVA
ncbi:unnamed protein product [Diabrotica balteata]|uniref:Uncharacterized protein n=1 Tax=Diabrotica balteata TaxID=107213 RepID=A0A9N9SXP3_DIABA|nr:unnamed protein product [Diabrotica balteata]